MKPTFFSSPAELRAWLEQHHVTATELLVGLYKKGSGKRSITWPELVDEALAFGWIDGIRRSIDDVSYSIRLTPRRPRSIWSAVNVQRAEEVIRLGRMRPAGLKAYRQRSAARSMVYSYEQRAAARLDATAERSFRARRRAWSFFMDQPAWYRTTAIWWVVSAKREETRQRRLATLMNDAEAGRNLRQLSRPRR